VGKQGETATNKDNNISKMMAHYYCHISPNMACFCKLMAQNWHKSFPSHAHMRVPQIKSPSLPINSISNQLFFNSILQNFQNF